MNKIERHAELIAHLNEINAKLARILELLEAQQVKPAPPVKKEPF